MSSPADPEQASPGEGRPLRVAALTAGRFLPSTRFRVRQHLAGLAEQGIQVREHCPAISRDARLPLWPHGLRQGLAAPLLLPWLMAKLGTRLPGLAGSWRGELTWLQRELIPGLPSLEALLRQPLVLDVDDALWLTPPLGKRTMAGLARRSRLVLAGNSYLADWFTAHSECVEVLPTAVDTQHFYPLDHRPDRPFTLGWIGTAGNLPYLEALQPTLRAFFAEHRQARLLVMADRPPRLGPEVQGNLEFRVWSENAELAALQAMDVGLMPLPDDPWTRGKCSFKMLQSMACGLPIVASPVGMNVDLFACGDIGFAAASPTQWRDALEQLAADPARGSEQGRNGRTVVEQCFSRERVASKLAPLLRSAAT